MTPDEEIFVSPGSSDGFYSSGIKYIRSDIVEQRVTDAYRKGYRKGHIDEERGYEEVC